MNYSIKNNLVNESYDDKHIGEKAEEKRGAEVSSKRLVDLWPIV